MAKNVVNTMVEEVSSQVGKALSLAKELEGKQIEVRLKFENLSLNGDIALSFIPVKKES
jgi:hypothetical protein